MEFWVYCNADENTQAAFGILLILAIVITMVAGVIITIIDYVRQIDNTKKKD